MFFRIAYKTPPLYGRDGGDAPRTEAVRGFCESARPRFSRVSNSPYIIKPLLQNKPNRYRCMKPLGQDTALKTVKQ